MGFARIPEKKNRILLIDANAKSFYRSLAASFKECKIILMPDPEKACEFFFHDSVDLVLLDLAQERRCIQMLQFFKSVKPFIPVFVMTAHGSEEFAVEVFRNGARDYFKKPLPMEEFKRSIRAALGIREASDKKISKLYIDGFHRGVGYIQEYYDTQLKLPQVAREAGMGVSSFARKFKKQMGRTFTDYVNRLRIAQATVMLMKEDLSMNEIALACGYNNQFHFTRMFKRLMKTSPTLFRKSSKA